MGNPPTATAGLGRPLSGDIDGGRGFARRNSPACDALGVAVALKLRDAGVLLTEGLGRVEVRRRVTVDNGRRQRRVGLRGEGRRRGTPGCWTPRIASGGACGGVWGVRSAKTPPAARKLPWRSSSPAAAPWRNFGDAEARGSIARLGELPGAEAQVLQGSAGLGV
jgi:hypothetical protein